MRSLVMLVDPAAAYRDLLVLVGRVHLDGKSSDRRRRSRSSNSRPLLKDRDGDRAKDSRARRTARSKLSLEIRRTILLWLV